MNPSTKQPDQREEADKTYRDLLNRSNGDTIGALIIASHRLATAEKLIGLYRERDELHRRQEQLEDQTDTIINEFMDEDDSPVEKARLIEVAKSKGAIYTRMPILETEITGLMGEWEGRGK